MSEIQKKIESRIPRSQQTLTRHEKSLRAVRSNNGPGTKEHGPSTPRVPNYLARRVGVAAIGLAAFGVAVGLAASGGTEAEGNPPETTLVVAEPGDTIWGLQREEASMSGVHPNTDIRGEIDDAVRLNGGTHVEPGQLVQLIDINPDK